MQIICATEPDNRSYVWSLLASMCVKRQVDIPPYGCLILASDCVYAAAANAKSHCTFLGYRRLGVKSEEMKVEVEKASVLEEVNSFRAFLCDKI